jgi:hypothetical protein
MDNGQNGTSVLCQGLLEMCPGGDVKMIDRLIKQQEGTALCHQQGQFKAGTFPVTHLSTWSKWIIPGKQEIVQEVTCFGLIKGACGLDDL